MGLRIAVFFFALAAGFSFIIEVQGDPLMPADSSRWPSHAVSACQRWRETQARFPRATSRSLEVYVSRAVLAFQQGLPFPRPRFHLYIADSIHPTVWPVGHGFFIFHSALITQFPEERQLLFLLALEMAHEALGHNTMRASEWGRMATLLPIENWTLMVSSDPIVESGQAPYSVAHEEEALELVYRFFERNGWTSQGVGKAFLESFKAIDLLPGLSPLPGLHRNLEKALAKKHYVAASGVALREATLGSLYSKALAEIGFSPNHLFRWMTELTPYTELLEAPKSYEVFETALKRLDAKNARMAYRDSVVSAQLARHYVKGVILLRHHRWQALLSNAQAALKLAGHVEPFELHLAIARQQLKNYNACVRELDKSWKIHDHKRELLIVQCTFLEGRHTDAVKLADEYRKKYPLDPEGAFWRTLIAIRTRSEVDPILHEVEQYWGDRPFVRALRALHFGYLEKLTSARALFEKSASDDFAESKYSDAEWGMFEFAESWLSQSFPDQFASAGRAHELEQRALRKWPVSKLVREVFAKNIVPVR